VRNLIGSTAGNFSQNQVRITFHPRSLEFISNPELSYEVLAKALTIDRAIGNRQGEATRLGNLGYAHMLKGNAKKGLEYSKQALSIFEQMGAKNQIEEIKKNIQTMIQLG